MWTVIDSANLRNFLSTETGKNLVQEVKDSRPKPSGPLLEEQAIHGAHLEQWHQDMDFIKSLRDFRQPESSADNVMLDLTEN